jgi:hypothetical protein
MVGSYFAKASIRLSSDTKTTFDEELSQNGINKLFLDQLGLSVYTLCSTLLGICPLVAFIIFPFPKEVPSKLVYLLNEPFG